MKVIRQAIYQWICEARDAISTDVITSGWRNSTLLRASDSDFQRKAVQRASLGTLWSDGKDTKEVILPQNFVPEGQEVRENDIAPPATSSNQPSDAQVENSLEDLKQWQKEAAAVEKEKASSSNKASRSSATSLSSAGRPKRKATWLPCPLGTSTANVHGESLLSG